MPSITMLESSAPTSECWRNATTVEVTATSSKEHQCFASAPLRRASITNAGLANSDRSRTAGLDVALIHFSNMILRFVTAACHESTVGHICSSGDAAKRHAAGAAKTRRSAMIDPSLCLSDSEACADEPSSTATTLIKSDLHFSSVSRSNWRSSRRTASKGEMPSNKRFFSGGWPCSRGRSRRDRDFREKSPAARLAWTSASFRRRLRSPSSQTRSEATVAGTLEICSSQTNNSHATARSLESARPASDCNGAWGLSRATAVKTSSTRRASAATVVAGVPPKIVEGSVRASA
mmetsp:Transcript_24953/g.83879  ORF Transcript_24953/g.83879 Transcript_24953/m.83879 type:complete len:292 (-) Transcript_24953:673-1548(-)